MDYIGVMFFNHLAHVTEEVRFVDGVEQTCLVIPTKSNQMMRRSSKGRWSMRLYFKEQPINPKGITHIIEMLYDSPEEQKNAKRKGTYGPTQRMGRMFARIEGLRIDRTNHAVDIRLDGVLVLSDIPKHKIKKDFHSKKLVLENLTIKSKADDGIIFTGVIFIDDIPRDWIKTNPDDGKKYINIRFLKMERFDVYRNTHSLVIVSDNGSELEIGRFREWVKDGQPQQPVAKPEQPTDDIHNTGVNQRQDPESIDGIRF